jgi:hypothetical protein
MSNPAQVQATRQVAVIPTPACVRPRRAADDHAPVSVAQSLPEQRDAAVRRSTARDLLDAALAGVRLGCRDSQFLARLVHWDKRNAASVASLLTRAREAGREEGREAGREEGREDGGLAERQLEGVLAALSDAAAYRASGAAGADCWDCEIVPGGRCAYHARDTDRARAYAELAAALSGTAVPAELPKPREISGYRRRTPVAS